MFLRCPVQQRPRVTCVAYIQTARGRKKGGDDRRCEGSFFRKRGELLVKQSHEFPLVQAIDEPAHESSQIGCYRGDRDAVSSHVRRKK